MIDAIKGACRGETKDRSGLVRKTLAHETCCSGSLIV